MSCRKACIIKGHVFEEIMSYGRTCLIGGQVFALRLSFQEFTVCNVLIVGLGLFSLFT